jgi:hypothetical protein
MQLKGRTSFHSLVLAGIVSGALAAPAPALVPRDAVDSLPPAPTMVDLRSPDAAVPVTLPATQPRAVSQPAASANDGFDVVSALMGAGAALLLALCGVALVRTRSVGAPHRIGVTR